MLKKLPTILCHTVPHELQAYDTAGNYWDSSDVWHVRVSETGDWRYEALVLIHELVEMFLTKHHKVSWAEIDAFDTEGGGKDHNDPGTLTTAPYHNQHMLAVQIEKRLAKMLDVNWEQYNTALDALTYKTGE